MTLTDDLAVAERRARDDVWSSFKAYYDAWDEQRHIGAEHDACVHALDRLAAVCRLAGRWAVMDRRGATNVESENTIRELARLMADVP